MATASTVPTRRGAEAQPDESRECGWGVVVVIAAHLSFTIQCIVIRSGGVLYLSWKEDFGTNDKETAAVQSICSSMTCFGGLLGGILTKRFGCRISGMVGGILMSLGLLCSYWVTDIYQLYITIFIVGTGDGICFNSAVLVIAMYFKRRYKIAHAIAISGNGMGTMVAPPFLQVLLENFGWRGTFLIASAIAANIITLSVLFRPIRATRNSAENVLLSKHQHLAVRKTGNISIGDQNSDRDPRRSDEAMELEPIDLPVGHDKSKNSHTGYLSVAFGTKNENPIFKLLRRLAVSLGFHLFAKSYRFDLLCVIRLEFNIAYIGFLLYLIPRAQSVGVAPSSAAVLLSIFGVGSLLGRLGSGLLVSWKISAEHMTTISMVLAGVSLLLLNFESYYILAIASFLLGFVYGFFVAVDILLTRQFVGVSKLAVAIGSSQIFYGIGAVTGPVLAGWILDLTNSYPTVFNVFSAMFFLCAVQMLLLPLLRRVEPGIDIRPTDV